MGITLEEIEMNAALPINPTIIRIMRVLRIARGRPPACPARGPLLVASAAPGPASFLGSPCGVPLGSVWGLGSVRDGGGPGVSGSRGGSDWPRPHAPH